LKREDLREKNEDAREADLRLANRRLQPLGHLTARLQVYVTKTLARRRSTAKRWWRPPD